MYIYDILIKKQETNMFFIPFTSLLEESFDDEVILMKPVQLNRLQVKTQLLDLFKDKNILDFELQVTLLDIRGTKEEGSGVGVTREVVCMFFTEFFESCSVGRAAKVPSIRHDMSKEEWAAVARIMIAAMKVGYYPLLISPAFMIATLFGESTLSDDILLESFKNYISVEEKDIIEKMLANFEENNEDLLEFLSFYKCYRNPTKDNLRSILLELSHQEIVQKPRYVSNCFAEVLNSKKQHFFKSVEEVLDFYDKHSPTSKKVIKALVSNASNDKEAAIFNHITRFVKSLSKDNLVFLLRFITAADIVPDEKITIAFENQTYRAPVTRTCSNTLFLSPTYTCYNELAEEFNNVLKNKESFGFHFV